jgi:thioredoxin 1
MLRNVTEAEFDEVVMKSDRPVLVDFWAPWCGPCRALAPTLEDIATDYEGQVDVVKVDIQAHPAIAERFSVRGIPLLMLVSEGDVKGRATGTLSRTRLEAFIDDHIAAD